MRLFDTYALLKAAAEEHRDYLVEAAAGTTGITIMAPHGGGIEPGTDKIAKAVAGGNHGYYAFKGIRPKGNLSLGLASRCFDEPRAMDLIRTTQTIITIHGCRETAPLVVVGGLDTNLSSTIADRLIQHQFNVCGHPPAALKGIHPDNLCNRGLRGQGVQLELSMGLRKLLLGDRLMVCPAPNEAFQQFIQSVRGALNLHAT